MGGGGEGAVLRVSIIRLYVTNHRILKLKSKVTL